MHYDKIHSAQVDGFDIDVYAAPDDTDPRDSFDTDAWPDVIDKILSGQLEWFMAKVVASKNGVELATDHLGGCCYEYFSDFISDDYYADMVQTTIADAKAVIAKLAA